jgi:membrane protein
VGDVVAPMALGIGSALFFWWTQRFLLVGRVPWRDLIAGSVLTGVGLMLLSFGTQLVASSEIATDVEDYGLVAASFALLVEVWCMSGVLLCATLIGAMWSRNSRLNVAEPTSQP